MVVDGEKLIIEKIASIVGADYFTDRDWRDYPETIKNTFRRIAANILLLETSTHRIAIVRKKPEPSPTPPNGEGK